MSNFTEKNLERSKCYKILVEQGYEWISLNTSQEHQEPPDGELQARQACPGSEEEDE